MKQFTLILCLAAIFSGCSSNKIKNLNDLKAGDQINGYIIGEIDQYKNITFLGEIVASGNLFYNKPTKQIGISTTLFLDKIQIDDKIIDLSKEKTVRFIKNPEVLKKHLNESTLNSNTTLKVKLKEFKLQISKDHVGMFAEIVEVLEINGAAPKAQNSKTGSKILNISSIKKGDKIEGLTVKNIDYKKSSHFNIDFNGKLNVSGEFRLDEFEGSYDLLLSDDIKFSTKFKEGNETYDFLRILNFKNLDHFMSSLNKDQKNKLDQGGKIAISVEVNNITVGTNFEVGRLGYGAANFVKFN